LLIDGAVNFVQRPLVWLEVLSRHRIEVAGRPNFGYDHCVDRFRPEAVEGLDLSAWRAAFNGAEPVRAETLERFARTFAPYGFRVSSFYPCYGLAEATLLVSLCTQIRSRNLTPLFIASSVAALPTHYCRVNAAPDRAVSIGR
jgi:acyl-CoA synthetase (AMP-forming)/AMP-acid ligase II